MAQTFLLLSPRKKPERKKKFADWVNVKERKKEKALREEKERKGEKIKTKKINFSCETRFQFSYDIERSDQTAISRIDRVEKKRRGGVEGKEGREKLGILGGVFIDTKAPSASDV